jgi:predicted ester cyclase
MSTESAHKKEIALAVSRSILTGDWKTLDKLLGPAFTYTGDSAIYSRSEYIGFMQALKDAMADMTMEFTHVVCEGDLVSIRFVTRAKNVGKFMGAPATRKKVEITGIFIRRVEGDQVVQEWQSTDLLGLMTQMGFGTLLGYSIAAGLLKKESRPPAPRPA